jgi:hypothetical protein
MLVEPDYRGHRIQVDAIRSPVGQWDAEVRIRRLFTEEKPRVERVTCAKPDRDLAERWGAIWARRWVDLKGQS